MSARKKYVFAFSDMLLMEEGSEREPPGCYEMIVNINEIFNLEKIQ